MKAVRIEDLRPCVEVRSSDDKNVGKLHAVVVDPRDETVTHVVVNAGPLFPEPGFGAPTLINVPIHQVASSDDDRIVLSCTKEAFHKLPNYADWTFTPPPVSWQRPKGLASASVVWMEELAQRQASRPGGIPIMYETTHKRSFEREIPHDAHVWRTEPHIHVGDVDRVLANDETEETEALVIRRGILFGHDVILPISYVTDVQDDVIHVKMSDEEIEKLERFDPEDL